METSNVVRSPTLNKEFGEFISQGKDLTDVLDWLGRKIQFGYILAAELFGDVDPSHLFSDEELRSWARDNDMIDEEDKESDKELSDFSEEEIKEHVSNEYSPEEIFSYSQLRAWAISNDFVEEE